MKLLFFYPGIKIKKDQDDNLYINGEFSQNVLKRYTDMASELTIISRIEKKIYDKETLIQKYEKIDKNKIRLIEFIDLKSSFKDFISIKNRIKNKRTIKKAIQENDKIIIRLPSDNGLFAVKCTKKFNKTCLTEVVACTWDALWNYGIKGKILALNSFLSMRKAIKESQYVIYVTEKFLQQRYPNKNNTLGCSDVDINVQGKDVINARLRKIEKMKNTKELTIGTIAAVDVKYKGQQYVIKAMSKLKKEGYHIKYYLIGGGDNNQLKELARKYNLEENIIFIGAIPHNKIFDYLDKLDIYIQPSKLEGLCRSIIEAMSRGCPVIASNVGGNSELIKKTKYIFKKGKYKEIVEIIKNIEKSELKNMAKENYNNSMKYSKEEIEKIRTEFYKKYLNGN